MPVSFTTLEPKLCERCGRSFFREANTATIYCGACERVFVDLDAQQNSWMERTRAIEAQKGEMMNGTEKQKPQTSPTVTPSPAPSPAQKRMCKVGDCPAVLSYNNLTGYCRTHRGAAATGLTRKRMAMRGLPPATVTAIAKRPRNQTVRAMAVS